MKNIIYILILSLFVISCDSEEERLKGDPFDESLGALSEISGVQATPRIGAAVLKWDRPSDSSYTYVEVRYTKNDKEFVEQVSRHADSLLVEGLINKEPIKFEVSTIKENKSGKEVGKVFETGEVTSIKRESEITFFPDELEQIEVTADMLDTYTQEATEGPKENLVDGDPDTYWHSSWSDGVAPLPHWIQVSFDEPQEIGAFKYMHRQGSDEGNRPTKWELEISEDGENWDNVWVSDDSVSTAESEEHSLDFEKNYEAKYFKFLIVETPNNGDFTYLGEISFHKMDSRVVDKEKEAEEEYYSSRDTLQ